MFEVNHNQRRSESIVKYETKFVGKFPLTVIGLSLGRFMSRGHWTKAKPFHRWIILYKSLLFIKLNLIEPIRTEADKAETVHLPSLSFLWGNAVWHGVRVFRGCLRYQIIAPSGGHVRTGVGADLLRCPLEVRESSRERRAARSILWRKNYTTCSNVVPRDRRSSSEPNLIPFFFYNLEMWNFISVVSS